jgi:hypothetical protein
MSSDLDTVKLHLGLDDGSQDSLISDLLIDSENRITSYLNRYQPTIPIKLPESLSWIVRGLTIKRFNRIGDEGKTAAGESDVSASWESDDLAEYAVYLDPITPKTGGRGIARFI